MDRAEYKQRLDGLSTSITDASKFFAAWDALNSENEEIIAAMNSFRGFFTPASEGFQYGMAMKLAMAFDTHTRVASFPNVLKAAQEAPEDLAPGLSDSDFAELSDLIIRGGSALTALRNKVLAHTDVVTPLESDQKQVYYDEFKAILDDSVTSLNRFNHAFGNPIYAIRGTFSEKIQRDTRGVQQLALAERRRQAALATQEKGEVP